MPRLERDDRFWEIERDGRRLRIRSGRIGEPGDQRSQLAHYEGEAQRELDRQIAAKLAEGYRRVHVAPEPPDEPAPELLAEVLAALTPTRRGPDHARALAAAWAVLGDWFAARGDARGELIGIDEALAASGPEPAALRERRAALLDQWSRRWLGELAKLDGPGQPIELGWDHGFVTAARIGGPPLGLDLDRFHLGVRDLAPVLAELLAHPSFALVRRLWIAELDPRGRRDLGRVLPNLAGSRRPALERLALGAIARGQWVRDELGQPRQRVVLTRIGSLAPLADAPRWAPRLRALQITGHELRELPALPQLRALELLVPSLTAELREWVASSPWPRLERVWLRAARFNDPWAQIRDRPDLTELLDQLGRGPLRELGLQGPMALSIYLDRTARARGPLRELRLFGLADGSVELLLGGRERLAGVERIVVEDAEVHPRWAELARWFGDRLRRCDPTPDLVATGG